MADLLTKHLDRGKLDKFCKMLGYEEMKGVDKLTLKAAQHSMHASKHSKIAFHAGKHKLLSVMALSSMSEVESHCGLTFHYDRVPQYIYFAHFAHSTLQLFTHTAFIQTLHQKHKCGDLAHELNSVSLKLQHSEGFLTVLIFDDAKFVSIA